MNELTEMMKALKDELEYKKKETAELDEKIELAKITKKYMNGEIKKDDLKSEIKKVVYRKL